MNKVYYGTEGWLDDLQISKTLEESFINVTATESFITRAYDDMGKYILPYRPPIGSTPTHNTILSGLVLRSWEVTGNGNYHVTRCTWGTPEAAHNEEDEDEEQGGEGSGEGSGEDEETEAAEDTTETEAKEREGMTITKDCNIVEYSIVNHPKYHNNPWGTRDILILSMWLSGNISVNDMSQNGAPLDSEKYATPENSGAVMEIMKSGKKTFQCTINTYNIKYVVKRLPKSPFQSLGKIATCKGVTFDKSVSVDGVSYPVNYIKSSVSITKMGRYKYSISESYRQSPPGGWDSKIYK